VEGEHVLLKRQEVDNFAIASCTQYTCNLLLDMINDKFVLPLKRLSLVDLFNSLDVLQTREYIKISCSIYSDKISEKHLTNWMRNGDVRLAV